MRALFLFVLLVGLNCSFGQSNKRLKLRKGSWLCQLNLNKTDVLPFDLIISKHKGAYSLTVVNGEEEVLLDPLISASGDSLSAKFPFFNSELVFVIDNKKAISGYWYNHNKGPGYKIPFSAIKKRADRFSVDKSEKTDANISGNWKVTFEPNTSSSYPALGVFRQEKDNVSGTFLTETGDYRYLDGNFYNDSLYLSCFDGSHAFLFKAALDSGALVGSFCSGNHWKSSWVASKNDTFSLTSPEDLTYVVEGKELVFNLPLLNKDTLSYPNNSYKNKVVIIQIMGTWCPNCLDETIYFKELYDKYHDRGLEIISIGYEPGLTFDDQKNNIDRLRKKLDLDFTFLVGGRAQKNLASEHFNMLNKIISFPTAIFVGRDGEIQKVFTGFNGPGTGEYYQQYVRETNAFVESLLAN